MLYYEKKSEKEKGDKITCPSLGSCIPGLGPYSHRFLNSKTFPFVLITEGKI